MQRSRALDRDVELLVQVVDDDRVTAAIVAAACRRLRARCVQAGTLEEACHQLRTHPVDVVVMDGWLPDGGGLEFMEYLRTSVQFMDVPVIFCTADPDAAYAAELVSLGVEGVLAKPLQADDLKRLLRIAFKKVPQRWEPARVAADRLGVTESEFQELLALAYEDLLELQEEVQRALTSKELCRENELRAMIFRARSAALNIGAVRLARIIDVLRVSKIECDDLRIFADVLGSETNAAFGPFRSLGAGDGRAPQRSA